MRNLRILIGGAMTLIVIVTALVALVWTPYGPTAIDILHRLAAPSAAHPFGTDAFGRDTLSMIMAGAENSIIVALAAVGLGAVLGIPAGLLAAARGGWTEELLMRGADLTFAFPALLTAVMITALRGPGAYTVMIAIGVFTAPVLARVTRTAAGVIWVQDYARAARALGRGRGAVTRVHILPNILSVLTVQITIQLSLAILAEAGLSFVGLGAQPPAPSWGRMLNDAQTYIYTAPFLTLFPGLAIALAVLGLNMLGDGLRDAMDLRRRRRA
ncbi:ABC transporter permease [Acidisoma silvae]|uniref:ABC transporter permease n=1 Tax=Acidisoma silvae TaxID=2802396 RepID=A0A963YNH3_9PROT|nr:ABC transporter permease [Acidisoma silvae]MCB8873979.1 ABC transporter permease [Acidisoma silvae]